ncbi:hypothetical protein Pelo_3570 [Pelomyxa schiedti]|nr:hypothetical protein Pelo_3570 [Pelomyxa schiedti]
MDRRPQQHRVWVVHTPTTTTATGDDREGEGGTRAAMVAAEEGWSGHDLASCILRTPGGSPHPSHHSHNQLGIPNVAPDDLLIALHGDCDYDDEDTPPPPAALRKYAGTGSSTTSLGGATATAAVAATAPTTKMTVEDIHTVVVVGAGLLGTQIALQCALHGYSVYLYDISEDALQKGRALLNTYPPLVTSQAYFGSEQVVDVQLPEDFLNEDTPSLCASDSVSQDNPCHTNEQSSCTSTTSSESTVWYNSLEHCIAIDEEPDMNWIPKMKGVKCAVSELDHLLSLCLNKDGEVKWEKGEKFATALRELIETKKKEREAKMKIEEKKNKKEKDEVCRYTPQKKYFWSGEKKIKSVAKSGVKYWESVKVERKTPFDIVVLTVGQQVTVWGYASPHYVVKIFQNQKRENKHLVANTWGEFRITLLSSEAAEKLPDTSELLTMEVVTKAGALRNVPVTDIEEIHDTTHLLLQESTFSLLLKDLFRPHHKLLSPFSSTPTSKTEDPPAVPSSQLPLRQQYNAYFKSSQSSQFETTQLCLTELKQQQKHLKTLHDEQIQMLQKTREETQRFCSFQYSQERHLLQDQVQMLKSTVEDLQKELHTQHLRYETQLAQKQKEYEVVLQGLRQHNDQLEKTNAELQQSVTQTYQRMLEKFCLKT